MGVVASLISMALFFFMGVILGNPPGKAGLGLVILFGSIILAGFIFSFITSMKKVRRDDKRAITKYGAPTYTGSLILLCKLEDLSS